MFMLFSERENANPISPYSNTIGKFFLNVFDPNHYCDIYVQPGTTYFNTQMELFTRG